MNHEPLRSLGLELFQLLTQPISQRAWSSLLGQRECRNFALVLQAVSTFDGIFWILALDASQIKNRKLVYVLQK